MKCPVCGRESIPGVNFCDRHMAAYRRLLEGYKEWRRAMNIGWSEYLKSIVEKSNAGLWVKEVAAYLVKEEA